MLIAGHGRLEAAKLEGIAEVPTVVARGWTEAQCQAYAIADNNWRKPASGMTNFCGSNLAICARPASTWR